MPKVTDILTLSKVAILVPFAAVKNPEKRGSLVLARNGRRDTHDPVSIVKDTLEQGSRTTQIELSPFTVPTEGLLGALTGLLRLLSQAQFPEQLSARDPNFQW